jgi:hypothetical protein
MQQQALVDDLLVLIICARMQQGFQCSSVLAAAGYILLLLYLGVACTKLQAFSKTYGNGMAVSAECVCKFLCWLLSHYWQGRCCNT